MKKVLLLAMCLGICLSAAATDEFVASESDAPAAEASATAEKAKKAKKPVVYNEKGEIIKTGLNFGPLPAVAYDADKGFQLGAILNIFNYGDGSDYPNYFSKWYFEASWFTKGSMLFQIMYDNKKLIPGVRWSTAAVVTVDKAFDFYGFNGYQSYFDAERIKLGKGNKKAETPSQFNYIYTPYYRVNRITAYFKTDFVGHITDNLYWEAGYNFKYVREDAINRSSINKNKPWWNTYPSGPETFAVASAKKAGDLPQPDTDTRPAMPTLFEQYVDWGLISESEARPNNFTSSIRAGLMYDTRDKEGAPSSGIWAEGHVEVAPKWIGNTNPFYRYALTFRHYVPIVKNDVLTFAYRLNYEGSFSKSCPYYQVPYITVIGENSDKDGMGGYRTVRGLLRDRVMGLDMATYTAEFRYRFVKFNWLKQNMAFALSLFSDGTMATRQFDMTFKGDDLLKYATYAAYMEQSYAKFATGLSGEELEKMEKHYKLIDNGALGSVHALKEIPHITTGLGLRFIMNENFIVAFEYGLPISRFFKDGSPYKNQDGTGAFYINIGYLF